MDVVDALAHRGRFFRVLQQTERSQTAVMTIAPGEDGGPSPLVGYTDDMRVLGVIIGLLLAVGALSPAAAQTTGLSTPNPQAPVFVVRPNPNGPFRVVPPGTSGSRESIPFSDEPHALNNPHPMLPNAGLGYAVRQVWMPPQPVAMQVYVPAPEGVPARYQTMFAQVPGFYVTETPTGTWIPERWVLDQVNVGVYQWRIAPMQFVPNGSR